MLPGDSRLYLVLGRVYVSLISAGAQTFKTIPVAFDAKFFPRCERDVREMWLVAVPVWRCDREGQHVTLCDHLVWAGGDTDPWDRGRVVNIVPYQWHYRRTH